jgi:hypothetical protein
VTRILLTAVLLLVTATSVAKTQTQAEKRTAYWQQKLSRELPVGSSRAAITKWAAANQVGVAENPINGELSMRLEYIPAPKPKFSSTLVLCNAWDVMARIKLGAGGELVSTQVTSLGHCL